MSSRSRLGYCRSRVSLSQPSASRSITSYTAIRVPLTIGFPANTAGLSSMRSSQFTGSPSCVAGYSLAGSRIAFQAARPNPPSRWIVWPTSIGASSEQIQATAAATSSGDTLRPAGTFGRTASETLPR